MTTWVDLHNAIHTAEEFQLPMPSSKGLLIAGAVGIPIAVLLHETSDKWLPSTLLHKIPVVSYFARAWRQDPRTKQTHLALFRDSLIFSYMAVSMKEEFDRYTPVDHVADRLTNEKARANVTREIHANRKAAFEAASDVLLSEASNDETKMRQLKDTELRRRHLRQRAQGN